MNFKMIFNTTGRVLKTEAAMLALPLLVSVIYKETCAWGFLAAIAVALALGFALTLAFRPDDRRIYTKEGLVTVALIWMSVSAIGALPFVISGDIPNYVDALFETISGFTTTGASIVTDVESLGKGILFWRSFTHWIGGMGVLVFVMAVTSKTTDRSIHLLRAEMPGQEVDKIVPRAKDTALILYVIYTVMTAVLVVMLLCGGMSLYDSVVHAFGAAGTGGFSIKADGIAGYNAYIQWVLAIFMLLFSVNFNLYYVVLIGKFKNFFKSTELWVFVGVVFVGVTTVTLNILSSCQNFAEALRLGTFQVSSIVSTTGYATADFNAWPTLSKTVLLLLMLMGGCAGSTAGGFKVSRVVIIIKKIFGNLKKAVHPRTTNVIKMDGKRVPDETIDGVTSYSLVYMLLLFLIVLLLSFDTRLPSSSALETNITAAVSCFNNVGPGLSLVGPAENYAFYSHFSKIVLSFAMLLGRLEIYPILLTLSPMFWIKK
ncbi:MAG: TrkH family potassium uptake protein [Faecalibacterium sp.]|nr:TrkH family potassium uptake protein [Faecalibacterium sp.]